jgi:hypothetical protein
MSLIRKLKNALVGATLATLSIGAAACGPSVTVATPQGFAVLDEQKEYVYRAASADNVVLAVRAEKNEPRGPLEFWADALDRKLRNSGYVPDGTSIAVRSADGLDGKLMKYTRDRNRRKHQFWIAVFVTDKRVWVVEAGGDAERLKDKRAGAVKRSIESMSFHG